MFPRVVLAGDALVALAKGAIMAATLTLLNVDFWRALIIASVSAILTGLFGLYIARLTVRETRKTRQRVEDVAGKVEADRRRDEHDNADEPERRAG